MGYRRAEGLSAIGEGGQAATSLMRDVDGIYAELGQESQASSCLRKGSPLVLKIILPTCGASLIAQLVKNLPAMQETLVRFLGQEDPLEKG